MTSSKRTPRRSHTYTSASIAVSKSPSHINAAATTTHDRAFPVRHCNTATLRASASSQFSTDVQIRKSVDSGGAGYPGNLNSTICGV
jgi:hypothetical protein